MQIESRGWQVRWTERLRRSDQSVSRTKWQRQTWPSSENNFRPMAMPESEKEKRRCGSDTLKLKKQVIPVKLRRWKNHFSGSEWAPALVMKYLNTHSLGSALQVDVNSLAFSLGDWRRKAGAEGSTGRQRKIEQTGFRKSRHARRYFHSVAALMFKFDYFPPFFPPPVHFLLLLWIGTRGFTGSLLSFISKPCFWSSALQKAVQSLFTYMLGREMSGYIGLVMGI